MALFKKKLRQRRLETRRGPTEQEPLLIRWIRRPGVLGSMAIATGFFLVATLLDVWPVDPLRYRQGQYVPSDITARVDFRVLSPEMFDEARRLADSTTPETFRLNTALLDDILASLEKIPSRLEAAKTLDKVDPALRREMGLYPPPAEPAKEAQGDSADAPPPPPPGKEDQAAFADWVSLSKPENRPKFDEWCKGLREDLTRCYIVRPDRASEQQRRSADRVLLTDGQAVVEQKVVDLVADNETKKVRRLLMAGVDRFPLPIRHNIETFLLAKIRDKGIYLYDAETSKKDRAQAVQEVIQTPPDSCYRHYTEDQVLARNTENLISLETEAGLDLTQGGLSEEELKLLQAEHAEYLQYERSVSPPRRWFRLAGRTAIVLLLSIVLCVYVQHYQHFLVEENWRGLKLAVLLLAMLALSKLLSLLPWANPHTALLPVCIGAIVLTVAYDQRFALAVGAILSAFVVFQIRGSVNMLIVLIGAQMLCVFQLREVRTRSKLVVASAISAAVIFLVVWALSIQTGAPWRFALQNSGWAAAMVLLAGLIVQSLLPAIEKFFNVATGSTLLEWCDASKPLLKRLATESPGTYNHSLQLGAMCEAAADTIGARGLLARVGAYYHDIGKINKPDYFAENQSAGQNKHDKLSPAMSLLIIINHVKDGMEMARRYGLPALLRGFITTHHGTTLVRYFYHSAAKQSEGAKGPAPDESQYRYPGPKPHLKEEAILMLADGAESSVRALSEPTPTSIRTQVHRIVTERLEDGQFDECDLTLREVHQIEESLVKSLCGIYHARIAYPKDEREGKNGKKHAAEEEKSEDHYTSEDTKEESSEAKTS
ncbi:MAG: HDIG domain-containing protein [Phycisphaerae bacterium]|nr:HDIG domain-containing protein [Phycisphaerae bacterium]